MSYQALARKWRPRKFSEVIGQEHVVSALTHALASQRIHHGFLFTGTRGVGKTTLARIFSKALNCETGIVPEPCGECNACTGIDDGSFIDLIEVDAASRTKVDDTRELLDNVQYSPSMGRFKIYLIDEVHMLSTHSFNALLKTLEEPPEHVKFLLATTDPQKLPATILSRCIQFNLKSMSTNRLTEQLEKILKLEGIEFDSAAVKLVARCGDGSVRDALSLLDQAIAYTNGALTRDAVRKMLGMIDDSIISDLLSSILKNEADDSLNAISRLSERAVDYSSALDDLLLLIHNTALYQVVPDASRWKDIDIELIAPLAQNSDPETLQLLYQIGVAGKRDIDFAPDSHSGFEMIVLRMLAFLPEPKVSSGQRGGSQGGQGRGNSPESPALKPQATAESVSAKPSPLQASEHVSTKKKSSPDPKESIQGSEEEGTEGLTSPFNTNQPKWTELEVKELLDQSRWGALIKDLELNGVPREMLRRMIPRSVDGNTLEIQIRNGAAYFSEDRLKQVEETCKSKFNFPIRFKVKFQAEDDNSDNDKESIAERDQRETREQEIRAREDFLQDPVVRELVATFDGRVQKGSIVINRPVVNS
ncbi:MAG: DNA polymerase III subunit gamma/tau [Gammaproteobacteria bacterium]|nr:DNA polymerase III subunit gamma/tau [Gammaproteobacteria bacterium]